MKMLESKWRVKELQNKIIKIVVIKEMLEDQVKVSTLPRYFYS